MSGNTNINLEDIAKSCNLYDCKNYKLFISKIENLKNIYKEKDLILILNYMLSKAQDPEILMYLIKCCDEYRDISSVEYLVNILLLKSVSEIDNELKEKFLNVRIMCAKAIGNQKNTDYVTSLLYCLNNKEENYRIRLACADALGRIGDKYAVTPLINVVQDENEKSVYLREGAASALGLLGDARALNPLVNILETKQGIMNKFSFLKERVIESLNKLGLGGDERVFKALKTSLSDESAQVRIDAIEAIMNSEHQDAFKTIKNILLTDNDEEVKKNALIALYNMSDRKILDEVVSSAKYSDSLKISAVEIIEEYENE